MIRRHTNEMATAANWYPFFRYTLWWQKALYSLSVCSQFEVRKWELNDRSGGVFNAMRKRTNAHRFTERRHVVFRTHSSARRNKLIKRTTHGSVSVSRRDWQRAKSVLESRFSAFVSSSNASTPILLSESSSDFLLFL